jgi:hypothetical protein
MFFFLKDFQNFPGMETGGRKRRGCYLTLIFESCHIHSANGFRE